MDRLDRISILAIVALLISSFALSASHLGEARPGLGIQRRTAGIESPQSNAEVENKMKIIKNIMESDNPGRAETIAAELIRKYPYEGQLHMAMGDILMRKQEPVKAMLEYKEAIDLNPDYLDKKTVLFQGKKLKVAVNEALAEIEKGIRLNPEDDSLRKQRKIIYYLQRRIAGSCS